MKRLCRILTCIAIAAVVVELCRALAPVFDAIDATPTCCCLSLVLVALLMVCVYCACFLSGSIAEHEERTQGVRRS